MSDELVLNLEVVLGWPFVVSLVRYFAFVFLYDVESPVFYLMKGKSWAEVREKVGFVVKILYEGDDEKIGRKYEKIRKNFEKQEQEPKETNFQA